MEIGIAGGHGKIGLALTELLSGGGDGVRGLIRNPDHADDVRRAGGEPVLIDLEESEPARIAAAIDGCDAVVFAAGAGPGSGAERKQTVDFEGAVKLIEAARIAAINRYVMISAVSADPEAPGEEVYDVYRRAKGRADAALAASGLDYTIVKPVRLTDEAGGGSVELGDEVGRGEVPRADVAAVVAAALSAEETIGLEFVMSAGDTPISEAIAALS